MSKKKKVKKAKPRNWLAVRAYLRNGAGSHGSKKKKLNKKACRGRVQISAL